MKKTLFVLAVASLLVGTAACGGGGDGGSGGGGTGGRVDTIAGMVASADATSGASTYNSLCGSSSCHGPNGNDGAANAGDLPTSIPMHDDTYVIDIIINGKGNMPAQSQLSDQEVADVVAYCNETFQ